MTDQENPDSLVNQIDRGLSSTDMLLRGLISERKAYSSGIEIIRGEMSGIKLQVESILLALYQGGNGHPGIVTQLALLRSQVENVEDQLGELEKETDSKFLQAHTKEVDLRNRRWQVFLATVSGGGILGALIWKIIELLGNK